MYYAQDDTNGGHNFHEGRILKSITPYYYLTSIPCNCDVPNEDDIYRKGGEKVVVCFYVYL
jgi:hypothetical protein